MAHLLKLSLGPVQGFIAAARKLEDLWAGSLMLSDLMGTAIQILIDQKATVLYPHQDQPGDSTPLSQANLPNVVLCQFEGKSPQDVAQVVADAVKAKLTADVRSRVCEAWPNGDKTYLDEMVEAQTEYFLDISWASCQVGGHPDQKGDLAQLNALFDAVKRTRSFAKLEQGGMKCTLQTNLSALAPKKGAKDREVVHFWRNEIKKMLAPKAARAVRTAKGERFSTLGLAKRLYGRDEKSRCPFPSTYSVATADWRGDLCKKLKDIPDHESGLWKAYKEFYDEVANLAKEAKKVTELAKDAKYDIHPAQDKSIPLLFSTAQDDNDLLSLVQWEPQCLTETEIEEIRDPYGPTQEPPPDPLAEVRKALLKQAKEAGLGEPPKHFALLLADGDSMGEIVDAQPVDKLSELSRHLGQFASEAVPVVNNAWGRLIYAGGDDIMAVTPVRTSLDTACQLRDLYRAKMAHYDREERKATLSVALLVAPVDYPLNRLLTHAHHLLNSVAKAGQKDALAINIFKGNSLTAQMVLPTRLEPESGEAWELSAWEQRGRELLQGRTLSSKSIYDLLRDLNNLEPLWEKEKKKRDLSNLETLGEKEKKQDWWDLAGKVMAARLCTARGIPSEELEEVKAWARKYHQALTDSNTQDRFLSPANLGQTLSGLQKTWRMWGQ